MKLIWCFILGVLIGSFGKAQSRLGTGEWYLHVPSKAIGVSAGNNKIMTAFSNGVLEYDINSKEKTIWSKVNFLSDLEISSIYFNEQTKSFWIGYANGNIDELNSSTIINLPDLKMSPIMGEKQVLKFQAYDQFLFAATPFGILKIDPVRKEVRDTYYPSFEDKKIVDFYISKDTIYALSTNYLYQASIKNNFLSNPNNWNKNSSVLPRKGSVYSSLTVLKNKVYIVSKHPEFTKDTLFEVNETICKPVLIPDITTNKEIRKISSDGNNLTILTDYGIRILKDDFTEIENFFRYNNGKALFPNDLIKANGYYWIADEESGLIQWENNWNNKALTMVAPPSNRFFSMDGVDNKLVVTGGSISQYQSTYNQSGAYIYTDNSWKWIYPGNQAAWKGKPIWDIGSVAISKNDPNRIALGSYSTLPLSIIENGETVSKIYDNTNSPLTPMTKDYYTMIADLKYDDSDNLWMINSYAEEPLKVLTPNGSWKSFNTGSSSKNTYVRKLYIDPTNTKWLSVMGKGLVVFNENEFDNPSDDIYRPITTEPNTGALPSTEVLALATDLDGRMWIGTDKGICVLYAPNSILASPNQAFSAQRIIVNVGGTGEYLLGNTTVTDIEIDGGNRKWIATANAGLYLVSKDGTEILQSFTTENSPIISNSILDLFLNQQTGELYIVTDLGLVSYRVDASQDDPTYSNVSVFPNPHKPSHNLPVTIQGIQANSDVKITDAAGNLIYRTTSNGGTATWDTQTLNGTRAMPGVYFIWTAPENSEIEGNYVGKVVLH